MKSFDEVFIDSTKHCTKIKTDQYHEKGKYIIIDQGQSEIAGYTDLEKGLFSDVPAIIFGDHTRVIKYVDMPFFIGADGVKVLKSKFNNANYKYLYYALKNAKIPNTGYNRHFKWLKETKINYPDNEKQAEIVSTLDKLQSIITHRQKQLEKLDELIKARFIGEINRFKIGIYRVITRRSFMNIKDIIESECGLIVHNVIILGQGLDSIAYLVNNEYIFKQSKHNEARINLKKEIQILNYLKGKTTLQIPDIEYYSEEYSVCGYKEIKGNKLTPSIYKSMSDDEKDMLAQDIALFLRKMHSVPLPDIDGSELNIIDDYSSDYDALRETIYDKIPDKSKEYIDDLYKRILNDERISRYDKAICHNDLSCNHIIIQNNKAVGIIDFGDAAITDRDKDFVYLLENSSEEIGREFGIKVLEYYNHPNIDIPIFKANLNDEYYPIEQILGGQAMGLDDMYNKGLNKIINI